MEEAGVDLVAVYFLTPDPYSLPRVPYLLDLIKPPRTVIVLNEWLMDAEKANTAFAPILSSSIVAAALADGARIVAMPDLSEAETLDVMRTQRPGGHHDARTGNPAISAWLIRMDENFAPVADWLD
jgi:hypothetical protein